VKHLIHVGAAPIPIMPAGGTASTDPDAAVPKEPAISPTGRVSNGMYDVYHVDVEADVDATHLADYLRSFGRNRFITPLWADIKAVDLAVAKAEGHDYGDNPVANVRTRVEVLYLRAWNKPLMPKTIRTKLGIPDDAPAAEGAAPTDPAATPPTNP
jgi:hypothetical protein